MRIGVYIQGYLPNSGGGYTFEQELIHALLSLCEGTHHEYKLYFNSLVADPTITLPVAKNLSSGCIKLKKGTLVNRLITKIIGVLSSTKPKSVLQKAAEKDRIQMMWFPTGAYVQVDIPYIATIWDIQHRIQPWFPEVCQGYKWQAREEYYARYIQRATYIVIPNQTSQNEIAFNFQIAPERFRQMPHPTPLIEHLPSNDEVLEVRQKYRVLNPYLIYPAQFWPHKNHVNLLKSLEILQNKYRYNFDLVLVGADKGNLEYVRSVAENLNLKDTIHFLGFISREDLIALYCGAFALTFVTYFGPENIPPLEAFVCRCPVIASSVAGAAEQLGEAALLVDPSHPEDIALAIAELKTNPILREELISKGELRAKKYTGFDFVGDIFKLFDEFEPVRDNWP